MAVKKKLGELLLEAGVIDAIQLKSALGHQKKWGCKLGTSLLELRILTEESLTKFLSSQSNVKGVDLAKAQIPENVFALISKDVASKYGVVPVAVKDTPGRKTLTVAMSNPTNLTALDELEGVTHCRIEPRIAPESLIKKRLQHYGEEFLQENIAVETPRVKIEEESKVEEVALTEEIPQSEEPSVEESVVIVNDAPEETATAEAVEEPAPLTEVPLEEVVPEPAQESAPEPVQESAPEPMPESPPEPSETQAEAQPEEQAPAQGDTDMAAATEQSSSGSGFVYRLDILTEEVSLLKASLEELKGDLSKISNLEATEQDLKNLIQTLLNLIIEKGIFTKEELISRMKGGK